MRQEESIDYELIKKQALEQFRSGKSLTGKGGAFAPLFKQFLEAALEAELEQHLSEADQEISPNRRNGKVSKTVKTAEGQIELVTSRDRNGSFEPEIIKKRETILADSLQDRIIGMYGIGMSLRDISNHIKEMYDMDISHDTLSSITERVMPLIKEWQSRPLDELYCIVWMDAIHYKVKEQGKAKSRAVYNILGINKEGYKDLLGVYVSENEGANFWLSVLTDLNNRGIKDILIACIDNLTGFEQAITSIFTKTEVQSCIVHQIRNSLKYVASKDQKIFMAELKPVYKAATKELAELNLADFAAKWGKKYPVVIKSWQDNWHKLSTYFKYTEDIRRIIYTTNTIEGFHRQVRKVTKNKGVFPSDDALLKLVYLAYRNISKKWTQPLQNWSLTVSQLSIHFEGRLKLM
ncbi:IS256 family transposase [Mucilaginibacter sp.]|uniref:IS256 family transposase n=1 Tax=Mucilaginibacter sp. TaxID=1882438 RepID=UPI00283ED513|nr:IS256 family transposase [Mucilaginibacter sp.]MDR3694299.1 IS256 family transposase [Mucilaginibacter sp.]